MKFGGEQDAGQLAMVERAEMAAALPAAVYVAQVVELDDVM